MVQADQMINDCYSAVAEADKVEEMLSIYFRLFNTLEFCCPRRIWLLREGF